MPRCQFLANRGATMAQKSPTSIVESSWFVDVIFISIYFFSQMSQMNEWIDLIWFDLSLSLSLSLGRGFDVFLRKGQQLLRPAGQRPIGLHEWPRIALRLRRRPANVGGEHRLAPLLLDVIRGRTRPQTHPSARNSISCFISMYFFFSPWLWIGFFVLIDWFFFRFVISFRRFARVASHMRASRFICIFEGWWVVGRNLLGNGTEMDGVLSDCPGNCPEMARKVLRCGLFHWFLTRSLRFQRHLSTGNEIGRPWTPLDAASHSLNTCYHFSSQIVCRSGAEMNHRRFTLELRAHRHFNASRILLWIFHIMLF